jgi:hypothetical protein
MGIVVFPLCRVCNSKTIQQINLKSPTSRLTYNMTINTSLGGLAVAGCMFLFTTGISQAQLGGSDLGATAPVPSPYDISQLLTTGDTIQLQDSALNYYYDNTSGGAGYVGTSFTTGGNAAGYEMTSLAVKFGGGGSVGYAGGNDTGTASGGWVITLFASSMLVVGN